jgi:tRNA nucleotidyltransferase (CCA-adding enzyme)
MKKEKREKIEVITTHINADFDSLASMLAAKKIYPNAKIVFPGSQEKTLRDFFVQSTFYIFEVERLRDIDLNAIGRLILVDTRQRSRIGKFETIVDRDDLDIHIYDHHPPSTDDLQGSVEVVREVGAATTLMTEILQEKGIEITPEEATVMALGIYEDTGFLTFSSTSAEDFHAMGYLRSKGTRLNIISDMIVRELTSEQVFLLNDLITSARKVQIKGVEVVVAKASADHYVGDFAILVHKLRDMENIDVLFAMARMEDRVYFVARSRIEAVNVGDIAMAFGGGGHTTAASATIKDLTMIQVEEKLIETLRIKISPKQHARDLMSFPVKTIEADKTIEAAETIMAIMNVNVLPVMDNGNLIGCISRMVVQKAKFHGLKKLAVRDYMTSDFDTATPDTSLDEVRRVIVEGNQRFLPILDGDKLVGAITRTDILRDLHARHTMDHGYLFDDVLHKEEERRKVLHSLLRERLSNDMLDLLRKIGAVADRLQYDAYAVGGFVRDIMLRRENDDIDIAIEGDGIQFAREFAQEHGCRYRSHRKFGTAVIIFPNGFKVDVATARTEYYERPAAMPTVELSSVKLDLYRRDFTINTLAVRLNRNSFGELLDFFGALRDIKDKTIRVLHNLSFVEDPTRILRAIRFEQRFGFKIGKHTMNLVQNAVKMNFLDQVEGKRLFVEFLLLLKEEKPFLGLKRMEELEILKFFHPNLTINTKKERLLNAIQGVLSWYDLLFIEDRYDGWLVYFYGFLDSLTNREILDVCRRLSFPQRESDQIMQSKQEADRTLFALAGKKKLSPSQIHRLLKPLGTEILLYMMARTEKRNVKRSISLYMTQLKGRRAPIGGEDLKRVGLEPGPLFKQILDEVLDAKLDGKIKGKEEAIEYVRKHHLKKEGEVFR